MSQIRGFLPSQSSRALPKFGLLPAIFFMEMRKTTQKTYHYFTDAVFALTILLIARVAPAQNLLYVGVSRAGSIDVITPAGVIQTNFITGLSLPTALAFNSVGNL